MKKSLVILFILTHYSLISISQVKIPVKPTPKPKEQSEVDKMMKELDKIMEEMDPESRKLMKEAMAKQQIGTLEGARSDDIPKIPTKQTVRISSMPKLKTKEQYNIFIQRLLSETKKKLSTETLGSIDLAISNHANDTSFTGNLPIILYLQKRSAASVYAASKAAQLFPSNPLIQNNLSFVLHQSGYPELAIPVLKNINWNTFLSPIPFVNLGYFYLSLGDTTESLTAFRKGLEKYPEDPELNCGIAYMLDQLDDKTKVSEYIKKSFHGAYSSFMDDYMTPEKKLISWSDIKPTTPEYFDSKNFKPLAPALSDQDCPTVYAARENLQNEVQKSNARVDAIESKIAKEDAGLEVSNPKALAENRIWDPFIGASRKAHLMLLLLDQDSRERIKTLAYWNDMLKKRDRQAEEDYQNNKKGISTSECWKLKSLWENYLKTKAAIYTEHIQKDWPIQLEYANQYFNIARYIWKDEMLVFHYRNIISNLYEKMNSYNGWQYVPEYTMDCTPPPPFSELSEYKNQDYDVTCSGKGLSVGMDVGVFKVKGECGKISVEMGEGIVGSGDYDFYSNEFNLFLGLGARTPDILKDPSGKSIPSNGILDNLISSMSVGGKVGIFVKGRHTELGNGIDIWDMGAKVELGLGGKGKAKVGENGFGAISAGSNLKIEGIIGATSGTVLLTPGQKLGGSGSKAPLFQNNFWKDL